MMSLERLEAKAERHRAKLRELQRDAMPDYAMKLTRAALERTEQKISDLINVPLTPELEAAMRKMMDEPTPIAAPGPDWTLVARRQFQSGQTIFPVGAEVPVAALGPAYNALINGRYVQWQPTSKPVAKSRVAPPPAPPMPNPPVVLVDDPDPVEAWRLSVSALAKECGGNTSRAIDLILATRAGADLFRLKTRVDTERRARQLGVVSVSPSPGF